MNSGAGTNSGPGNSNHLIIHNGYHYEKGTFENLQSCNTQNFEDPKGNLTPVEEIGDVPVKLHWKNGIKMVLRNVL